MNKLLVYFCIFFAVFILISSTSAQTPQSDSLPSPPALTLDDCIRIALKDNPQVITARNNFIASKGKLYRAWGGLLPTLEIGLGLSFFKSGTPRVNRAGQIQPPGPWSLTYQPSVTLSQTIFNGGANWHQVAQEVENKDVAYQDLQGARQDLVVKVKEAYFGLLKARMLREIQKEAVKRSEQQLKIAQSKFDLGSASLSDVLKAKVQYENDRLASVTADNTYELSKANLNFLMKREVNTLIEVREPLTKVANPYTYAEAINQARASHPSILRARADYNSSRYLLRQAKAAYIPSVVWGLTRSWNVPDSYADRLLKFDQIFNQWSVFISANFSIFDGFTREAALIGSRVNSATKKENVVLAENQVALEVKQAFLGINEADQKLQVTEEAEKSAQEDFNITQEKYNLGAATILDLLTAQVNLKQAQSNRVQALFDYNLAIAKLEKAIGKKY